MSLANSRMSLGVLIGFALATTVWFSCSMLSNQDPASPTAAIPDRDAYYPGTETLAPDEMRVIACGTGMPNARPKQAAA